MVLLPKYCYQCFGHYSTLKTIRIKQRTEPWISSQIRDKIATRDSLLHMYKETLDESLKSQYNKVRNEIQRDITSAKADYLQNSFEENIYKPKKLWQQLKSLGYSNKTQGKTNIVLRIAGTICYNTLDICNYINKFFTTIASNLVSCLPPSKGTFSADSDLFKNHYLS